MSHCFSRWILLLGRKLVLFSFYLHCKPTANRSFFTPVCRKLVSNFGFDDLTVWASFRWQVRQISFQQSFVSTHDIITKLDIFSQKPSELAKRFGRMRLAARDMPAPSFEKDVKMMFSIDLYPVFNIYLISVLAPLFWIIVHTCFGLV